VRHLAPYPTRHVQQRMRQRGRRGRAWALPQALLAGAVLSLAGGCAGSAADARKPTATLSSSPEVEGQLRLLVARWARGSRAERAAMGPELAAFRGLHANDPVSRFADLLLTWIALDARADLHAVEVRAREIGRLSGPGTVADIARTLEGAAIRRQGQPERALELLLPLVSKLIDPWARALYNQEVVESAVEAGRWDRALPLMRVWLREAGSEERATARADLEKSLTRVPPAALLELLDGPLAPAGEEDAEMRKLVAQRLAAVARQGKDAGLAQHLLTTAGRLLGEQGDMVAQLATSASRARVEARTVGLVLSLRNDETRRRGADIAEGVAFGLGLPGSAAHLVSRDDHGSPERLEEALAALSADGASILIAGGDPHEATVAAAFAEAHHVPVLLLRPPVSMGAPASKPPGHEGFERGRFTFVIGADAADLESTLVGGLAARGAAPVAILAGDPALPRPTRPEVVAVRGCADAAAPWKPLGAAGVVLSAPIDCAREAIAAAAATGMPKLRFAAGLEPEALVLPPGSIVATAGLFPFTTPPPPALGAWLKGHPGAPTWWGALGHDAAVLAWAGVQVLPPQGTEDPAEVEARRALAASALAGAQADLWTTDARGFNGARTLPRPLGVREAPAPSRP
jgi:hypothetical protein